MRRPDERSGRRSPRARPPLLRAAHHALLPFGGAAPTGPLPRAGDRLRVADLTGEDGAARRYRAEGGGWVPVRPDRVIAARGAAGDWARLGAYAGEVLARAAGTGAGTSRPA